MRDLFLSFHLELPPADPDILKAGLRDLAREEPALAPLILGCLDSEGLRWVNADPVYKSEFHPLDDALNALFDLMPKQYLNQPDPGDPTSAAWHGALEAAVLSHHKILELKEVIAQKVARAEKLAADRTRR